MTAGKWIRSQMVMLLALAALTGTGCVTMDSEGFHWAAPTGSPRILTVMWNPQVFMNPDTVHDGTPVPTLAGSLYIMGEHDRFIATSGKIVVDLYDISNGKEPQQLERWVFDQDSLKKLLVCDGAGWGYKLILPWGTYRPDIAKVEMRVQLDREKLLPLYSGTSTVTLAQPDHPQMLPGTGPQKPPEILMTPMNQQRPQTGMQQMNMPQTGMQQMNMPQTGMQQMNMPQTGMQQMNMPQTGMQQMNTPQTGVQQMNMPQTGMQQMNMPQTGMQQSEIQQVGWQQSIPVNQPAMAPKPPSQWTLSPAAADRPLMSLEQMKQIANQTRLDQMQQQ